MSPEPAQHVTFADVPLFASLPRDEIRHVLERVRVVDLPAGTVVVREDEPGDCLYVILEGRVEVVKALGTPDQRTITVHETGSFFGEMSLLDPDGLRTASVRTCSPARLMELARADFEQLLLSRPLLAYEMLRVLSRRLREAHTATIADLRGRNLQLTRAYEELRAAQAQLIEKERLERELQVAREIQRSILPRALPRLPGFAFGARFVPAREVGGDLFDFIPLGRHRLGVFIGDVSGKGVPAAIFMALTRSLMRAEAMGSMAPGRVLAAVNRLILGMQNSGLFVTMLYGILDRRNHTFTYARAGHELPLVLAAGGAFVPVDHTSGQPLGMFTEPILDECVLPLAPGSTLLLYTDGATDALDPSGNDFGIERLEAAMRTLRDASAQELCNGIMRLISEHQAGAAQFDDIAMIAIRAEAGD